MIQKKDLKYFMRSREAEIVSVPGPKSFVVDYGMGVPFEF